MRRTFSSTALCFLLSVSAFGQSNSNDPAVGANGASSVAAASHDLGSKTLRWETGVYAATGFAIANQVSERFERYDLQLRLYTAGITVGRQLTGPHGRGMKRGDLEYLAELEPFWLGRFPNQTLHVTITGEPLPVTQQFKAENFPGIAFSPLLLRYNFTRGARVHPWAQLGGGLLWTDHKFPAVETSVINFRPELAIGTHLFTGPRQSVTLGVRAVHISNANLGDHNPGVNVSLMFRVGYTWWH